MSNRVCIKKGLLTLMGAKFVGKQGHPTRFSMCLRSKTTSAQYVATRFRDPTFEKLMDNYKNLVKVIAVQDLILANPKNPSVSIDFLSKLSQKLHLNRGATAFLRKFPHIFHIYYDPSKLKPFCRLTDAALDVSRQEAVAINASLPDVVGRLVRILSMSASRMVPLRAVFKVWKELGLPDDFEDSVISANSGVFQLFEAHEPNTHLLKLVDGACNNGFRAAVEDWRVVECCKEDCSVDRMEMQFNFKQGYPPGMRLTKNFKAKVKEWQRLPYVGPYEVVGEKKKSKAGMMAFEKRAVSIVHEFLSLTVEKMVEVEKISQFRNWFGIDLNIRDLFLDHPGIFYLSTKGKRHTVFLREAYERGCLIEPNPIYDARRRLLDLVVLGRRGLPAVNSKFQDTSGCNETGQEENQQSHDSLPS
ncbi:protein ROOT PRIMORDIUM DEFECTIVE 1-like [Glycine soja]|uniref:Protein ROOT PRIMORDIUM DEFECTIVE 1 n=2 Tax=Glycine soja TaxID=3848 RepID=A0A445I503_GLYSO|nr:protein ROOT PRIMORDIUM DEFECTIVE 1-like [Glycine soja]RZB81075.1 Protein ROOT PRIMORDIUM DEFECTIVE 1 [Glycine soja]